jgi:hypothetical protein
MLVLVFVDSTKGPHSQLDYGGDTGWHVPRIEASGGKIQHVNSLAEQRSGRRFIPPVAYIALVQEFETCTSKMLGELSALSRALPEMVGTHMATADEQSRRYVSETRPCQDGFPRSPLMVGCRHKPLLLTDEAHGCGGGGGGGTSCQVTCVLDLSPEMQPKSHALCSFNSLLQPQWFADVVLWIDSKLMRDTTTTDKTVFMIIVVTAVAPTTTAAQSISVRHEA